MLLEFRVFVCWLLCVKNCPNFLILRMHYELSWQNGYKSVKNAQ